MKTLAIMGGEPVVKTPLQFYKSVGDRERLEVQKVLDSGCLSGYVGAWGDAFDGGPAVKEFESNWRQVFKCNYAIAVNSATSGLYAAIGACGVGPGDEVIVPPYTMSATAMAPLVYGGIPVFCDIEADTFCLDPDLVRKEITPKTKAIIAVNLFGHAAKLRELRQIADEHGLYLIEDNAQGPFATENDVFAGTIGHIGIFSLNYHKHIHTGEGGMCVTQDEQLALKLRLIRNHGENAAIPAGLTDLTNMVGFNYRLTEMSAAVGIAQLAEAQTHLQGREETARKLSLTIKDFKGLTPPMVRENCRHVYYVWAMKFDKNEIGVSRDTFSKALFAEGFPNYVGYVKPLYMLPMFQKKIAFGAKGFPFNLSQREYYEGMCPVVERMHSEQLIWFPNCVYQPSHKLDDELCQAITKVYESRAVLRDLENKDSLSCAGSGNRN